MLQELAPALRMTALLTVLTGLLYPTLVTAICQTVFREQANGSLLSQNGKIIGSSLIGQNFARPEYFHPRPSAAGNNGYDATASSASNLGPTSQKLYDRVKAATAQFRKQNSDYTGAIPVDAVTASGSGLDPDISMANALAQAARVARARNVKVKTIEQLVKATAKDRDLGFLGEPRINVLKLNIGLDRSARD